MNLLKKMMQTGVLASLLYSGISAKAEDEADFLVYGSPEVKHDEYIKLGYFKAPESAEYGFSLYLNQTNPITLVHLESRLAKLPASFRSALKEVRINNQDEKTKNGTVGGRGGTGGALAIHSQAGLTNGTFFHECAHVWVDSLDNEKRINLLEQWDKIAQFNYGPHNITKSETEWNDQKEIDRKKSLKTRAKELELLLDKEQTEIAKIREGLEKDSGTDARYLQRFADFNTRAETFNRQSQEYEDTVEEHNRLIDNLKEPRQGVFSAYGSTDRGEDIAEAWKTMLNSPEKARALLKDPDSRYAAKMRLLAKEAGVKLEEVLK
jgi:hypothetical protein